MGFSYADVMPPKELLEELVKYLSNEKIAALFHVACPQTISVWTKKYGIKRTHNKKYQLCLINYSMH